MDEVKSLDEYQNCLLKIGTNPIIQNHLNKFVGTATLGGVLFSTTELMEQLAAPGWLYSASGFDEMQFNKLFLAFEHTLYGNSMQCVAVAPLQGMLTEVNEITFSDEVALFAMQSDLEEMIFRIDMIRRTTVRWTDRFYAVRAKFSLPKVIVKDQSEISNELRLEAEQIIARVNRQIENVIHTLKVFKHGTLFYGGIARWSVSWPFSSAIDISGKPLDTAFGHPYIIDISEINALKKFWSDIQSFTTTSHDGSMSKVFRLLGSKEHNWVNLYKAYEIIEQDVGGVDEVSKRGWSSKREIKRFKHTANSVAAAGDESRHGKEVTSPPSTPMSLQEAQPLIVSMFKNWLDSKIP